MFKRTYLVLFLMFFLFSTEAFPRATAYLNILGGTAYWNSKSLNRLTEGLNSGYGTTFTSINMPYELFMEAGLRYNDFSFGFIYGFDYTRRNSISSLFAFTQVVKLAFMPFGFTSKYFWYSNGNISLSSGLVLTFFKANITMSSDPNPLGESDVGMAAWGKSLAATIDFDYKLTEKMFLISTMGFRYVSTSNFKYTTATGGHNTDDLVLFNDGTNLTLNLSGLNFLLGIKFYFGET